jgi:hypothetical protein
MFKKIAADALGLSDIGKIVSPTEYDNVESDDFIFHEDDEKIFFLIKSKKDEYCFTNRALIHVDGDSAVSSKRMLKRYEYYKYPISHVYLETAGRIDLDIEIKFHMGDEKFSVDVDKNQLDQLKDLYKALYNISSIMSSNLDAYREALESISSSLSLLQAGKSESVEKTGQLKDVYEYLTNKKSALRQEYIRKDFSEVYLKYINN